MSECEKLHEEPRTNFKQIFKRPAFDLCARLHRCMWKLKTVFFWPNFDAPPLCNIHSAGASPRHQPHQLVETSLPLIRTKRASDESHTLNYRSSVSSRRRGGRWMTVLIFSNPFLFQGELLWPLFPSIFKHTHTHICTQGMGRIQKAVWLLKRSRWAVSCPKAQQL